MRHFLIVAPNWLGDAVMALPAIADIRRARPDLRIAVAARASVAPLFSLARDVDAVIEKGAGPLPRTEAGSDGSVGMFDAALLLPNSFRSALDAARSGIRERWGYRTGGRGFLLTRGVPAAPPGIHQVDYYQRLVRELGFANGASEPRLELSADVRDSGARVLAAAGWDGSAPVVALAPGAAFGSAKRWPPDSFAELILGFSADGIHSVLVGSAGDEQVVHQIDAAIGSNPARLSSLVGRTDLATLAGVLTHVRALVGNDSGVAHLAAALGVRATTVFGPTDEHTNAPRSISTQVVLTHPVWCRPCWLRECPLDHACMRGVAARTVAEATRRLL
jgi:heptosyltransferase-2